MKNNFHNTILMAAAAMLLTLTACYDSFSAYYKTDDSPAPAPETITYPTEDMKVPVDVALKVVGLDKIWNSEITKEEGAKFRLWGLRLANFSNEVAPDWSQSNDNMKSCYNTPVTVNRWGGLTFDDDSIHRYDNEHPFDRYTFFITHNDTSSVPYCEGGMLKRRVVIDGKSDFIVGCACINDRHIDSVMKHMPLSTRAEREAHKLLSTYRGELFYSNLTAMREVMPTIFVKKLFTKFNIQIRGQYDPSYSGDSLYRNIIITGIDITTPKSGVLTIANPKWMDRDFYISEINKGRVFSPSSSPSLNPVELDKQKGMTSTQKKDYNFYIQKIKDYEEKHGGSFDAKVAEGWWHVNNTQYEKIISALSLPPSDSYTLRINYYYVNRMVDDKHCFTNMLQPGCELYKMIGDGSGVATYTLRSDQFTAGTSHTIYINALSLGNLKVTFD